MKTNKPIQIFKQGNHTAMSGAAFAFSEADLAATAAAYDPAKHEAPIVIGHPKHDGPAYGWVRSLAFADGLTAEPQQVDPAFAEMVSRGSFKKISASFYEPNSPSNPVPGVYYLRHVGFLGAQPPAVKGLRSPEFADAEQGVIEFADWDDVQNASLWRRLRDWMIGEKGLDVADNILPDYTISNLEAAAQKEDDDDQAASSNQFTEPQNQGDTMTPEEIAAMKASQAALKAENEKLKATQLAFAEADKKRAVDVIHADSVAFAEALVKDGKLLPANKALTIATLDFMASQDQVVEFGEGDAKKSLLAEHKAMLQAQPVLVNFGESAGGQGEMGDGDVDPSTLAAQAIEFQENEATAGRVITTAQAVQHISQKQGAK